MITIKNVKYILITCDVNGEKIFKEMNFIGSNPK